MCRSSFISNCFSCCSCFCCCIEQKRSVVFLVCTQSYNIEDKYNKTVNRATATYLLFHSNGKRN